VPTEQSIPEADVLVAAGLFLSERGVVLYRFSPPRGRDINTSSCQTRIYTEVVIPQMIGTGSRHADRLKAVHSWDMSAHGPDIIGISPSEWWQVECKGCGSGKAQTHRNNFDRGLASVVSYYVDKIEELPARFRKDEYRNAHLCLGLAMPAVPAYLSELRKRARPPLRKALNLWLLLYEPSSKKIIAVSPEEKKL